MPLIFFLALICLDGYPIPSPRVRVLVGVGTGKNPEGYLALDRHGDLRALWGSSDSNSGT